MLPERLHLGVSNHEAISSIITHMFETCLIAALAVPISALYLPLAVVVACLVLICRHGSDIIINGSAPASRALGAACRPASPFS